MNGQASMERKAMKRLFSWKESPSKKALLLKGCRQTGKTHLLLEFAEKEYESYVYFNLEERRDIRGLFEGDDISAESVFERISFESPVKLVPGKSAVIFDEIQSSPGAYSALKPLAADGRYDILASGSLLGNRIEDLQRLSPMGYTDTVELRPMDFEEFLWAVGLTHGQTEYLRRCIRGKEPIDGFILKKISDYFRRFIVVGGMPAAVSKYAETRNYGEVRRVLKDIIDVVRMDAEKYSEKADRLRISKCFDSIPMQLASENKKFFYSEIEKKKGSGKKVYGDSLLWLERAGLIQYSYNLEEPVSPLAAKARESSFKIYMADTGILVAMMEPKAAADIVNRDVRSNNGAAAENAVACALAGNGYPLYFYERKNSTLEVDFVINCKEGVAAVEVKSGRNKGAKSLRTLYTLEKRVARGIKLSETNISEDINGIENYPLFAPCFFDNAGDIDIGTDDMESLQKRFGEIL
jgi:predicted AAA+ superfamily ATPase